MGGRHDGGAQGGGILGFTPPSHTPAQEGRLEGVHLLQALVSGQGAPPAGRGRAFLWSGHQERLAWQELHRPLPEGGLAISCVQSRAQALWAKQACWALGGEGQAAQHLAYWLGPSLEPSFPDMVGQQRVAACPPLLAALAPLLEELTAFGTVEVAHPAAVTAKGIYLAFTDTLPPPKVELKFPDYPWPLIWRRLWRCLLPPEEADLMFQLVHNMLPVRARLGRFTATGSGHHARLVRMSWRRLSTCSQPAAGSTRCGRSFWPTFTSSCLPSQNQELLSLAFAECEREDDMTATILT